MLFSALAATLAVSAFSPARAQSAPYVLPYTMSTYVGGNPYNTTTTMTLGQACYQNAATPTTGMNAAGLLALDSAGDGCFALNAEAGSEPHDVRVDAIGNLFFLDNTQTGTVIHRVNPFTQLMTAYAGATVKPTSVCKSSPFGTISTYGDNCPATDGVANSGNTATTYTTYFSKLSRGLGIGANGDLYDADYGAYVTHKITATLPTTLTGLYDYMTLVAGTSASGGTRYAPPSSTTVANSFLYQPRGISTDNLGNIFIADTGNNAIREVSGSTVTTLTGASTLAADASPAPTTIGPIVVSSNIPASTTNQIYNLEDVQIDSYGNIYFADAGNAVVRAIYKGNGTLIGYTPGQLTSGNIYTIAGVSYAYNNWPSPYPTPTPVTAGSSGISPTYPAQSKIFSSPRKIAFDAHGNLYISDSGTNPATNNSVTNQPPLQSNVVWFLDAATAQMRVIAGSYGQMAAQTPVCTTAQGSTNAVGDGCPATEASLYPASDMGAAADTQGNLYITDAENSTSAAAGRIRKVLSGLNFPTAAIATATTQKILLHFAPADAPTTSGAYTITGNGDFVLGTASCAKANDTTMDCLLPVTFTPSVAGLDTATLTVASQNNGKASFQLSGYGTAASLAFDPGNIALATSNTSAPNGIALDGAGNAYIADTGNNRVLFYNAAAQTTAVIAGGGSATCAGATDSFGDGCLATATALSAPQAVAIDTGGNLFIADTGNNVIRKVTTATGIITLYAGGATSVCATVNTSVVDAIGDGCPGTQATFKAPAGLAADTLGNIYVADTGNNVIRIIASNGYVSLLAGTVGSSGTSTCTSGNTDTFGDGCNGIVATFKSPHGLAFDATGKYILVADTGNNAVREIYLGTTYGVTSNKATNILINPVTRLAGNSAGQAGSTLDSGNVAHNSELSGPTGVAVDAAENVYIADTGNHAIRLVNASGGLITTIAGILTSNGDTAAGGSATATQLTSPGAVAVTPAGSLVISDSGNNRLLFDTRSSISYNFGRVQPGTSSSAQGFTEVNIGNTAATLPSGVIAQTKTNTAFTLTPTANGNGSISACASGSFASGQICNLIGQFNPPVASGGLTSVTYTETGTGSAGGTPTINLSGTAAILTSTNLQLAQTVPATGSPQFGGTFTVQATVTPSACNVQTTLCYPTGSVIFTVDGTSLAPVTTTANTSTTPGTAVASVSIPGLSVGQHTIGCSYATDGYYNGGPCPSLNIVVAPASTNAVLNYPSAENDQPQFTSVTFNVQVSTVTPGLPSPTGTVTFTANGTAIGTVQLNGTGTASLTLAATYDSNFNIVTNTTLLPGNYQLACTYTGNANSNYANSACSNVSFTVAPQPQTLTLKTCGALYTSLYFPGTTTVLFSECPAAAAVATPTVATADGSTTDATIFIIPTNTVSGTLTFSCTGVPAASTCTFSPTSITLTAGTSYAAPVYTDMTLWTDLQPNSITSLHAPDFGRGNNHAALAEMIGWPLTLLGLLGVLRFRRRIHSLALFAVLMVMAGLALTLSGCAGPGAYKVVLTPAGTYPITVKVTGSNGLSQTTVVNFTVTSPGITGQQ